MKISKKARYDIILVAVILCFSLIGAGILLLTRKDGAYAVVKIDGVTVAEYPLSESKEHPLNGGTNILVIENGGAYIKWANCPKQVCVNQGVIRYVGDFIQCAHNKIDVIIIEY